MGADAAAGTHVIASQQARTQIYNLAVHSRSFIRSFYQSGYLACHLFGSAHRYNHVNLYDFAGGDWHFPVWEKFVEDK